MADADAPPTRIQNADFLEARLAHTHAFSTLSGTAAPFDTRYRDDGEIGRGGCATVHRVFDKNLSRDTAVKFLNRRFARDPGCALRFLQEARLTGQLEHPGIVPVHEVGAGDAPYFCMKLVRGRTLLQRIEALGSHRLEARHLHELVHAVVKAAEAVAYAHSRGVVHRDLKPANVMLGDFGEVYVMDWGVAHVLPRPMGVSEWAEHCLPREPGGTIVGTPAFMAPEQTAGDVALIDVRTDVFGLGTLLYYILTAQPPHLGTGAESLVQSVGRREVDPPGKRGPGVGRPGELGRIAMRAMATRKSARYPHVLAMLEDLKAFARGGGLLTQCSVPAGGVVVREGVVGQAAFLVEVGRCAVVRKDPTGYTRVIAELGPGEVFGEAGLVGMPRTATVVARTDLELRVIRPTDVSTATGEHSWLAALLGSVTERFVSEVRRAS